MAVDRRTLAGGVAGFVLAVVLLLVVLALNRDRREQPRTPLPEDEISVRTLKEAPPLPVSEEAKRASMQHYLSGVIYFQKASYSNARDEWKLAARLDPGNLDAQAGLKRLDAITASSR